MIDNVSPDYGVARVSNDAADAERYRYLCMHPDWHFMEMLCRQFPASTYDEFKAGLDAAIDKHRATAGH